MLYFNKMISWTEHNFFVKTKNTSITFLWMFLFFFSNNSFSLWFNFKMTNWSYLNIKSKSSTAFPSASSRQMLKQTVDTRGYSCGNFYFSLLYPKRRLLLLTKNQIFRKYQSFHFFSFRNAIYLEIPTSQNVFPNRRLLPRACLTPYRIISHGRVTCR